MSDKKVIEWVTMTTFAKELGVSLNTFKKHFLDKCKPNQTHGNRKYWTRERVEGFKQELNKTH